MQPSIKIQYPMENRLGECYAKTSRQRICVTHFQGKLLVCQNYKDFKTGDNLTASKKVQIGNPADGFSNGIEVCEAK